MSCNRMDVEKSERILARFSAPIRSNFWVPNSARETNSAREINSARETIRQGNSNDTFLGFTGATYRSQDRVKECWDVASSVNISQESYMRTRKKKITKLRAQRELGHRTMSHPMPKRSRQTLHSFYQNPPSSLPRGMSALSFNRSPENY